MGPAVASSEEVTARQQSRHADGKDGGMAGHSCRRRHGEQCVVTAVDCAGRSEAAKQVRKTSVRQGERRSDERSERDGQGLDLKRGGGGARSRRREQPRQILRGSQIAHRGARYVNPVRGVVLSPQRREVKPSPREAGNIAESAQSCHEVHQGSDAARRGPADPGLRRQTTKAGIAYPKTAPSDRPHNTAWGISPVHSPKRSPVDPGQVKMAWYAVTPLSSRR